jgi:hypothetical protein
MKNRYWLAWRLLLVLCLAATVFSVPAWAGIIMFEEFKNDVDPSNLTLYADPGFSASHPAGWEVFTKAAGTGDGFMRLVTDFWVSGDFTAVTVAKRVNLPTGGRLGLALYYTAPPVFTGNFADVYFAGPGQIYAWVHPFTNNWVNDSGSEVWFQIRRVGATVYDEYGVETIPHGGYYSVVFNPLASWTDPSLTAPVRVALFMAQEEGYTTAQEGQFDVFVIGTPDGVPEPATFGLLGAGLLGLVCLRRRPARR